MASRFLRKKLIHIFSSILQNFDEYVAYSLIVGHVSSVSR